MPSKHTPVIKAFLIADQVFQQVGGKWCITGVFTKIHTAGFPSRHPSLGVFVVVDDAEGDYDVRLEMRDHAQKLITKLEGFKVQIPSRKDQGEFGIQTHMLLIPKPGRYFLQLYFNDDQVSEAYFDAALLKLDEPGLGGLK